MENGNNYSKIVAQALKCKNDARMCVTLRERERVIMREGFYAQ